MRVLACVGRARDTRAHFAGDAWRLQTLVDGDLFPSAKYSCQLADGPILGGVRLIWRGEMTYLFFYEITELGHQRCDALDRGSRR